MKIFGIRPYDDDRILSGEVSPDDAPPGYSKVVGLLEVVGSSSSISKDSGEKNLSMLLEKRALLASQDSAGNSDISPAQSEEGRKKRQPIFVAAIAASVLFIAAIVSAANGSLPVGLQNSADHIMSALGVGVPNPPSTLSGSLVKDSCQGYLTNGQIPDNVQLSQIQQLATKSGQSLDVFCSKQLGITSLANSRHFNRGSNPGATAPGHGTNPSSSAPGQGSNPGATAPGQGSNPGATAPGQGSNPSSSAPGQGSNPGATAPGQVSNPSSSAPGQGSNPGATAPGSASK